jgi:hypothetical protein
LPIGTARDRTRWAGPMINLPAIRERPSVTSARNAGPTSSDLIAVDKIGDNRHKQLMKLSIFLAASAASQSLRLDQNDQKPALIEQCRESDACDIPSDSAREALRSLRAPRHALAQETRAAHAVAAPREMRNRRWSGGCFRANLGLRAVASHPSGRSWAPASVSTPQSPRRSGPPGNSPAQSCTS